MDNNRPSASEVAKAAGLPSLNYIQEKTGTRRNVLDVWNKTKPDLFDVVVLGCAELMRKEIAEGASAVEKANS